MTLSRSTRVCAPRGVAMEGSSVCSDMTYLASSVCHCELRARIEGRGCRELSRGTAKEGFLRWMEEEVRKLGTMTAPAGVTNVDAALAGGAELWFHGGADDVGGVRALVGESRLKATLDERGQGVDGGVTLEQRWMVCR